MRDRRVLDVLVMGINYLPEPSGNAPYTAGLAQGLHDIGRDVGVFTGYPHYPNWRRYKGYEGWRTNEILGGVSVRRFRHHIPQRPRGFSRLWMELSFGLHVAFTRWGRSRAIVLVSPALFSAGVALLRTKLLRSDTPTVVWVQDLYSLGMTETGTSGRSGARIMSWIESLVLRSADGVVVIHDRFKVHLVDHLGVAPSRVTVIRNWTHLKSFSPQSRSSTRASLGWHPEDIVVLHAGNMGAKQGLENVVEAARLAEDMGSPVRFVLLGNGNQRARLEQLAAELRRIDFIDSLPGTRFQEALSAADVLLVNELPGVKEMSVPSKLTSYFSSGVPVLAATDSGSVTAEEVEKNEVGLRVDAGAPSDLVAGAELLATDTELGHRLAQNGRHFMETMLSEAHAVDQYDRYLAHLVSNTQPRSRPRHHGDNNA